MSISGFAKVAMGGTLALLATAAPARDRDPEAAVAKALAGRTAGTPANACRGR